MTFMRWSFDLSTGDVHTKFCSLWSMQYSDGNHPARLGRCLVVLHQNGVMEKQNMFSIKPYTIHAPLKFMFKCRWLMYYYNLKPRFCLNITGVATIWSLRSWFLKHKSKRACNGTIVQLVHLFICWAEEMSMEVDSRKSPEVISRGTWCTHFLWKKKNKTFWLFNCIPIYAFWSLIIGIMKHGGLLLAHMVSIQYTPVWPLMSSSLQRQS